MQRTVCLTVDEAKAMLRGGKTQITIPLEIADQFEIGDEIAFKEPLLRTPSWMKMHRNPKLEARPIYQADETYVPYAVFKDNLPKRDIGAYQMPKSACRFFGKIIDIRKAKLQDLQDDELIPEKLHVGCIGEVGDTSSFGFHTDRGGWCDERHHDPKFVLRGNRGRLAFHWNSKYKNALWQSNPDVVVVSFAPY